MSNYNVTLSGVIDNDLCIACGACIPACPRDNLIPSFNEFRGAHEVAFVEGADCSNCPAPCVAVCPSVKIDFLKISDQHSDAPEPDGWIKDVYIGHSPEHRKNNQSSSGGVLRAIVHDAINKGIPVVALSKSDQDGIDYFPRVFRQESELSEMPGSIYHSTSFVGAIELIRNLDKPCLLVAIPCQLAGIYSYIANIEPPLREKIAITCGLMCGWMYSYHAHRAFMSYKKLKFSPNDITYRGGDKVGKLVIKDGNNSFAYDRRNFSDNGSRFAYQASYSTDLNRLRCRLCQDHTNLLADIVAGDAWLKRTKSEKVSVIGVRTERGAELLNSLLVKGAIVAEKTDFRDVIESQSYNLVHGSTAKKLALWMKKKKKPTVRFHISAANAPSSISTMDSLSFSAEFLRRKIVRNGWYKIFLMAYIAKRKIRSVLEKINSVFKA